MRDFPGELAISAHRGGWRLLIHGPHVAGDVTCTRREGLEPFAEAYAQMRREQEKAPGGEAFWAPGGLS